MKILLLVFALHATVPRPAPTVTFSGHSETLLRYYQQEETERIQNLLALIQMLSISTSFPTLPDLSFHLFGWGQVDFIDTLNPAHANGDLNTAYVSYRDPQMRFYVSLGRQYLYQNQKVLHFDGGRFDARLPLGFGVRAFAGWAVQPQFGPSAGYFLAGARVSHRVGHISEVGVTFLEMLEQGQPAHEIVGVDATVVPLRWLELSASASMDLHLVTLRHAGGRIDLTPWRWLRFAVGYEYAMPSAFVSKQSIFSVFSGNSYHEGFLQLWFYLWDQRLSIGADFRLVHLPDVVDPNNTTEKPSQISFPSGEQERFTLRFRYTRSRINEGWIGASVERVREHLDGHLGGRLFWQQQIYAFALAADFQYFHYRREIGGYPHGFFAALSGKWQFAKGWDLTGTLTFTSNPFVEQAWLGLLKLSYQFFVALPVAPLAPTTPANAAPVGGQKR